MQNLMKASGGRSSVKLYNVMFPLWMLLLFPTAWLAVLPANFIIDLAILVLGLRALGAPDVKASAKLTILRVWLMGFLADFIGGFLMLLSNLLEFPGPFGEWFYEKITIPTALNPFTSLPAFLYTTLCLVISGLCIYWFNRAYALKRLSLPEEQKRRLALTLALCTAPYLFYFPTTLLYR